MLSMSNSEIYDILQTIAEMADTATERAAELKHKDQFVDDSRGQLIFDAICMNLIVIGEKLKKLDNKTAGNYLANYPDIVWAEIIRMRDIIAHHYTNIKNEIIFDTVKKDIPLLRVTIAAMMRDLELSKEHAQ